MRKLEKTEEASHRGNYGVLCSSYCGVCAQYVMLAMSVASMVSSTVAKHRESKARREAWQKGETLH